MRNVYVLTAAIAATVCAFPMRGLAQDAPSGKMAAFAYLLTGPWNCTTNVPAMGGEPAHVDQATARFEMAPGNAIHKHVASANYTGDYYFGYSEKGGTYWQSSADNMGSAGFLTSTDGQTYTGTSTMGPASMKDTVTYTKAGDNRITLHEVLSGAGPQMAFDTVCTR